jgi:hypothetical protein
VVPGVSPSVPKLSAALWFNPLAFVAQATLLKPVHTGVGNQRPFTNKKRARPPEATCFHRTRLFQVSQPASILPLRSGLMQSTKELQSISLKQFAANCGSR